MLARIVEVGIRPEKKQEFITLLQHELVPLLHRQSAFVGFEVVLRKDNPGLAHGTSYWNTQEEADAFYSTPAYNNIMNKVKTYFTTEFKPVYFTVEISTAHRIAFGKAA